EMWEDLVRPATPRFPNPDLLAFARIAGLIGYLGISSDEEPSKKEEELEEQLDRLRSSRDSAVIRNARLTIARWALMGWRRGLRLTLPRTEKDGLIYSVNRNRPATLALAHSVKTVKGDAATQLFSIKCKDLTWAIVDCGIDATHPAFLNRSNGEDKEPTSELQ